jgi:hypothetical protein
MKTIVDEALRRSAHELRLRYSCEHCAHFDVEGGGCAEGFPNDMHRERRVESSAWLEFCKSFELL